MQILLNVNVPTSKAMLIEDSLKTLAENLDSDNLTFLAQQSSKKNVNDKLRSKKGLIQTFL